MAKKKRITIVAPTFNEEESLNFFFDSLKKEINKNKNYEFDIIIIDNASTDGTQLILKSLAKKNKFLKVIINVKNFGHIRSPYYGILQSDGDATIYLASDLQDPPWLISQFLSHWEKGFKIVWGVKRANNDRTFFLRFARNLYYWIMSKISDSEHVSNATGFGLYDKEVINAVKALNDPYPYFRGIVASFGFPIKQIHYEHHERKFGVTKNNFSTLYDNAILGVVNQSTLPLRLCALIGFFSAIFSFLVGIYYLITKLFFWNSYEFGFAPIIIFISFGFGLILFFIGIMGEYLAVILRHQQRKPIVIVKEKINF